MCFFFHRLGGSAQVQTLPYLRNLAAASPTWTSQTANAPRSVVMDSVEQFPKSIGTDEESSYHPKDGVYFVMAVVHVGVREVVKVPAKDSEIFVWFESNGMPKSGRGNRVCSASPHQRRRS